MIDISSLRRRALGAVCLAAIVVAPAACGGGDDDDATPAATTTTTAAAAPESCGERMLALLQRSDVVEAARTEADALPADAEAAFEALDAECGDELDAMPEAELAGLLEQVEPFVLDYVGEEDDSSQEFQETGSAISGL